MKLIYHVNEVPNFGDDLNVLLWPAIAPDLFADEADGLGFLGIGTIVGKQIPDVDTLHVFSSGAGYDHAAFPVPNVKVHCVRGPLTARLLGLPEDRALTDGAILTPLVIEAGPKSGKTLVIPHWQSLMGCEAAWQEACDLAGFHLCSPIQEVGKVIAEIAAADYVITESLHGAILADTYGVPWAAWACSGNFSDFKWLDWLKSLNLKYQVHKLTPPSSVVPLNLGRRQAVSIEDLEQSFREHVSDTEAAGQEVNAPNPLKTGLKRVFYKSGMSSLFGLNGIARTARELRDIARADNFQLSDEGTRATLRSEMLSRLDDLRKEHSGG